MTASASPRDATRVTAAGSLRDATRVAGTTTLERWVVR